MKTQASDAVVKQSATRFIAHRRPKPYQDSIAVYDTSVEPRLLVKYASDTDDAKQTAAKWNTGKMRQADAERIESLHTLRGLLKPGDTVHTILRHVSRSGMMRRISAVIAREGAPLDITWDVARVLGDNVKGRSGWVQDVGISVGGCGMDMGFHLVEGLSSTLYPEYQCLGKGKHCPSNYHVNHRDRVSCEGIPGYKVLCLDDGQYQRATSERFATRAEADAYAATISPDRKPEVETDYKMCWESDTIRLQSQVDMCDCLNCAVCKGEQVICAKCNMCTRCHEHRPGCEGCMGTITVDGRHANTIHHDDDTEEICPTCKGEGYVPNPEGPERWNLLHTDGYALHQRWL